MTAPRSAPSGEAVGWSFIALVTFAMSLYLATAGAVVYAIIRRIRRV